MKTTTHYMRSVDGAPAERVPFTEAQASEARSRGWAAYSPALSRDIALELVNLWNRGPQRFRYWLES